MLQGLPATREVRSALQRSGNARSSSPAATRLETRVLIFVGYARLSDLEFHNRKRQKWLICWLSEWAVKDSNLQP
jgi:hypothetical protein